MSLADHPDLLTTTQAAPLANRSIDAVRRAILRGHLPRAGRTELGHHLVRREDVVAWARRHPAAPRPDPLSHCERTGAALGTLGPATAEELAIFLDLHPGNVRKHLFYLARLGRAQRRPDGRWALTTPETQGVA